MNADEYGPKYSQVGRVQIQRNDTMGFWMFTHEQGNPHCTLSYDGMIYDDAKLAAIWMEKGIEYGKLIQQENIRKAIGL